MVPLVLRNPPKRYRQRESDHPPPDNPGLELHLDGQRDIKRFLEEKIAPTSQVLYVTHSPAMIDPFNLGQKRAPSTPSAPRHENQKLHEQRRHGR